MARWPMRHGLVVAAALAAAGCSTTPAVNSLPASPVVARGETIPVGTARADAADDPAIWRNAANPAASLIVATDKKAGLHVYGLDGKSRSFDPAGLLNNVDLIDLGARGILVAASDRNDLAAAKLRLYRLDPASGALAPLGVVDGGAGEAYGLCLAAAPDGAVDAFSVLKSGAIEQVRIRLAEGAPTATRVRSMKVASQPEGCVVDPRTNSLYVGEEIVGIWRFDSRADASSAGTLVAKVDNKQLVADVEGLALAADGATGGWLIASSQGDNAYAVYSLPDMAPVGRFRIVAGKHGATEETDGIGLVLGDFGPDYPGGLFVAQDGVNPPSAQNFKYVSWDDIRAALGAVPR